MCTLTHTASHLFAPPALSCCVPQVINDGLMLSKDADSHQLAVFREQHGQFSRAPLQKMMSIVSCFLQGR